MKSLKSFRILTCFFLIILILFQPACYNRAAAVQLTETAIETSDTLAEVYEDLAKQAEDTWDLSIYATGVERIREEERRAELARNSGASAAPTPILLTAIQQKLVRDVDGEIENYFGIECHDLREKLAGNQTVNLSGLPASLQLNLKSRLGDAKSNATNRCVVEALRSRVNLARSLSALFTALKDFADYDFAAEGQSAVESAATSAESLIPFPQSAAVPVNLIGEISADIFNNVQNQKVSQRARAAKELVRQLQKMFSSELPVYRETAKDFTVKAVVVSDSLLQREMLQNWDLVKMAPTTLGIPIIADKFKTPLSANDERMLQIFRSMNRARAERISANLISATAAMNAGLVNLIGTIDEYLADSKKLDIGKISAVLDRVNTYLDEAKKAREDFKKEKKESEEKNNVAS